MLRKLLIISVAVALWLPIGAASVAKAAQQDDSARIDQVARDIDSSARRVWDIVRGRSDQIRTSRNENGMQLYLALSNFVNTASVYSQFASQDATTESLRGGGRILITQAEAVRRLMRSGYGRFDEEWSEVEGQVARLSNAFSLRYAYSGAAAGRSLPRGVYDRNESYSRDDRSTSAGRFRWRGQVDGSDYIMLRGSQVTVRHLKANPITDATFDLTDPLPRRAVQVTLTKLRGRGRVELVQQPSYSNNYTAMVLIEDDEGSTDHYEFELSWGR
jgi:hypothetical protein